MSYHVIATKHYGEEDAETNTVSQSSISAHFLVICAEEEKAITLVKEATQDKEFDKFTVEKAEARLAGSNTQNDEQVYSL